MSGLDARLAELAKLMDEFGLAEARLAGDGWAVALGRHAPASEAAAPASGAASAAAAVPSVRGTPITSPMTGTFWAAPSPGADAFVSEGDVVVPGQVVGLIEAMKVFNEITATVGGTVSRIAATSGGRVEAGDPLMFVE